MWTWLTEKFTLIENWRKVMARSWSVRLMFLAGIFSGLEAARPYLESAISAFYTVKPGWFAIGAFISTAAATVARLLAQEGLSNGN